MIAAGDQGPPCRPAPLEAYELLAGIFDAIADPVFVKDDQHRLVVVNAALCRLAGLACEDLLGRTDADFFPASQVEEFLRSDRLVLETGAEYSSEEQIPDASGAVRSFITTKTRLTDAAGRHFVVGVLRDSTARQRAEQARAEASARYEQLAQTISNGVAIYRPTGDGSDFLFVDINPAGERMSAVGRDDVIGRRVTEVFPAVGATGLLAAFRRVWRTGNTEQVPAVLYDDGRIRHWVANTVCRLPSGEIAAVYDDVTERRLAELQIQGFSRQLLSAREDERKRLAVALHHDLGSLSVGVSARLDAVEDELVGRPEVAKEALDAARQQLRSAVARLKQVAIDLRPPDLEILGLSDALRQHYTAISGATDMLIHFADGTAGARLSDEVTIALFRIGQEALTNAVRHASARRVGVRLSLASGQVTMSVRDDGCGFDLHAADRPAGMGLISMREMARARGGSVDIDSRRGRGTRVTVTLPHSGEQP